MTCPYEGTPVSSHKSQALMVKTLSRRMVLMRYMTLYCVLILLHTYLTIGVHA